ncbi:MAG: formimidoylglutamate deiminase [Alphaproteobacteria bacterium]|nr:formimidoylglutamate deiminase [Alphaproteobacteria bacterium]
MSKLFFNNALLPGGWARDVLIEYDPEGWITGVAADAAMPEAGSSGHVAVPGVANLHSHAFQRAMAGLGEWRGNNDDSFWSWREVMYRFLGRLRPQDTEAIAAQLYVEMLEAGFTAVGEFHYVHHQPDGQPYDNLAEMAHRIQAAAAETGIGLTMLPVFYANGGFGGQPVGGAQKRFSNDVERYLKLRQTIVVSGRDGLGIAPHSLRAVTLETLSQLTSNTPSTPIHIHIAEQSKEVEDCISWSSQRPVEWLLEHQPVDQNWCLIHATHMTDAETQAAAAAGAIAGLCPITEANLGDGTFNGVVFDKTGGQWGVGSDSHIRIDLAEELRALEYSQRLRDLGRNRLAANGAANGRSLFQAAAKGGASALQQNMGAIEPGRICDVVSLDHQHPVLIGKSGDDWLNSWIFAGDSRCVRDVWVSGSHVVADGHHRSRSAARTAFAKTMEHLLD